MNSPEEVGVADLILSGVLGIVTNSRAFREPTPLGDAIDALDRIRAATGTSQVRPGSRHWSIFTGLCRSVSAAEKLVPDAYHAALAIEMGATFITADRDFFPFPGSPYRGHLNRRHDIGGCQSSPRSATPRCPSVSWRHDRVSNAETWLAPGWPMVRSMACGAVTLCSSRPHALPGPPWQCFHLRPLPQGHGSLRGRRESRWA